MTIFGCVISHAGTTSKLKIPATSCGGSPTVKENIIFIRSHTPPQAAGYALAVQFKARTWLCYYGSAFEFKNYSNFDLIVFNGHNHPPLKHKSNGYPIYLGYLSLGETHRKGPFWSHTRDKPYLLKKNKYWDSWLVDIRDPAWQSLIFEKAIPQIFERGFDGIFIDTIDSSLSLRSDGIEDSILKIIKQIREAYPEKLIAVNRGLTILPAIAPYLDFVVVEDLYSYFSFEEHNYIKVTKETREILLDQVAAGLEANKNLIVLTLDYAGLKQHKLAREAIAFSKKHGFIPYVSTYKLDHIFNYTLN